MAGNVAEWTVTPGAMPETNVVVGGSYRDPANELMVEAQKELSSTATADWLGFRCIRPRR
jgi:formylglycine-generating enzyme required for sulfatase activity